MKEQIWIRDGEIVVNEEVFISLFEENKKLKEAVLDYKQTKSYNASLMGRSQIIREYILQKYNFDIKYKTDKEIFNVFFGDFKEI